jgi:hypothetical protein
MSSLAVNSTLNNFTPPLETSGATSLMNGATLATHKLVMSFVTLGLLGGIKTALAGPIAYGACVTACGSVIPPFVMICIAGCAPLLAAPTP